jgi:sugar phosphate permease
LPKYSQAVGTLAGLINSVGSCGSIFQSYATTYVTKTYGWSTLFSIFVLCASICSAVLFRASFNKKDDQLAGHIKAIVKGGVRSIFR